MDNDLVELTLVVVVYLFIARLLVVIKRSLPWMTF